MSRTKEAFNSARLFFNKIEDPFLRGATEAIFLAKPATGPNHALQLAHYCKSKHKKPQDYLIGMYRDPRAREQLLEAINAAHEKANARPLGHDELTFNWLKILVAVSETEFIK